MTPSVEPGPLLCSTSTACLCFSLLQTQCLCCHTLVEQHLWWTHLILHQVCPPSHHHISPCHSLLSISPTGLSTPPHWPHLWHPCHWCSPIVMLQEPATSPIPPHVQPSTPPLCSLVQALLLSSSLSIPSSLQPVPSHTTLSSAPTPAAEPRRSRRTNKGVPLAHFIKFCDSTQLQPTKAVAELVTPELFGEAIVSPDVKQWVEAMHLKHQALVANCTYMLVPLPWGHIAVGTKWLYKIKSHMDRTIKCYKAWWVAKGYFQHHGIDYDETFALVVCLENLHMLLAYITLCDFEIDQMDVDSAFLQAGLSETVYIKQLEGFVSQTHPDYVCRLNKSLYGLKQAPLMWNCMLDRHLWVLQFQPLEADLCIYVRK